MLDGIGLFFLVAFPPLGAAILLTGRAISAAMTAYKVVFYGGIALKALSIMGAGDIISDKINKGIPVEPRDLEQFLYPEGVTLESVSDEQKEEVKKAAKFLSNSVLNIYKERSVISEKIQTLFQQIEQNPDSLELDDWKIELAEALNKLNEIEYAFKEAKKNDKKISKATPLINFENIEAKNLSLENFETALNKIIPKAKNENNTARERLNNKINLYSEYKEAYEKAEEMEGENDPVGDYFASLGNKQYDDALAELADRETAMRNQAAKSVSGKFSQEIEDFFTQQKRELKLRKDENNTLLDKADNFMSFIFGSDSFDSKQYGWEKRTTNGRTWVDLQFTMSQQNVAAQKYIFRQKEETEEKHKRQIYAETQAESAADSDQEWYKQGPLNELHEYKAELEKLVGKTERYQKNKESLDSKVDQLKEVFYGYKTEYLDFEDFDKLKKCSEGKIYFTRRGKEYDKQAGDPPGQYRYKFIDQNGNTREGRINFGYKLEIHDGDTHQNEEGSPFVRSKTLLIQKVFQKERKMEKERTAFDYRISYYESEAYGKINESNMIVGKIYVTRSEGLHKYQYKLKDSFGNVIEREIELSGIELIGKKGVMMADADFKIRKAILKDAMEIINEKKAEIIANKDENPLNHYLPKLKNPISRNDHAKLASNIISDINIQHKPDTWWQRFNNWREEVKAYFLNATGIDKGYKPKKTLYAQTKSALASDGRKNNIEKCLKQNADSKEKADEAIGEVTSKFKECERRISEIEKIQEKTETTKKEIITKAVSCKDAAEGIAKKHEEINKKQQEIGGKITVLRNAAEVAKKRQKRLLEEKEELIKSTEALQKEINTIADKSESLNQKSDIAFEGENGTESSHAVAEIVNRKMTDLSTELEELFKEMPELEESIEKMKSDSNEAIHAAGKYHAMIPVTMAANVETVYEKINNTFSSLKTKLASEFNDKVKQQFPKGMEMALKVLVSEVGVELDVPVSNDETDITEQKLSDFSMIASSFATKLEEKIKKAKAENGGSNELEKAESMLKKVKEFGEKLQQINTDLALKEEKLARVKATFDKLDQSKLQEHLNSLVDDCNKEVNKALKENLNAYITVCINKASALGTEINSVSADLYAMTDNEQAQLVRKIDELKASFNEKYSNIDNAINKLGGMEIIESKVDGIANLDKMKLYATESYQAYKHDKKSKLEDQAKALKDKLTDLAQQLQDKLKSDTEITVSENNSIRELIEDLKSVKSELAEINKQVDKIKKESEANKEALEARKTKIEENVKACETYESELVKIKKVADTEANAAREEEEKRKQQEETERLAELEKQQRLAEEQNKEQETSTKQPTIVFQNERKPGIQSHDDIPDLLDEDGRITIISNANPHRNEFFSEEIKAVIDNHMERITEIEAELQKATGIQEAIFKNADDAFKARNWDRFNEQYANSNQLNAEQRALVKEAQWHLTQLKVERINSETQFLSKYAQEFMLKYDQYLTYENDPIAVIMLKNDPEFKKAISKLESHKTSFEKFIKKTITEGKIEGLKGELQKLQEEAISEDFKPMLGSNLPTLCLPNMNPNGEIGERRCDELLGQLDIAQMEAERVAQFINSASLKLTITDREISDGIDTLKEKYSNDNIISLSNTMNINEIAKQFEEVKEEGKVISIENLKHIIAQFSHCINAINDDTSLDDLALIHSIDTEISKQAEKLVKDNEWFESFVKTSIKITMPEKPTLERKEFNRAAELKMHLLDVFKSTLDLIESREDKKSYNSINPALANSLENKKNFELFGKNVNQLLKLSLPEKEARLLDGLLTTFLNKNGDLKREVDIVHALTFALTIRDKLSTDQSEKAQVVLANIDKLSTDLKSHSPLLTVKRDLDAKYNNLCQGIDILAEKIAIHKEKVQANSRFNETGKANLITILKQNISELEVLKATLISQYNRMGSHILSAWSSTEKNEFLETVSKANTILRNSNEVEEKIEELVEKIDLHINKLEGKQKEISESSLNKTRKEELDKGIKNELNDLEHRKGMIILFYAKKLEEGKFENSDKVTYFEEQIQRINEDVIANSIANTLTETIKEEVVTKEKQEGEIKEKYEQIGEKILKQMEDLANKSSVVKDSNLINEEILMLQSKGLAIKLYYNSIQFEEFDYENENAYFERQNNEVDRLVDNSITKTLTEEIQAKEAILTQGEIPVTNKLENLAKAIFVFANEHSGWSYNGSCMTITDCEEYKVEFSRTTLKAFMQKQGITGYTDKKLPEVIGLLSACLIVEAYDNKGNMKELSTSELQSLVGKLNSIIDGFLNKHSLNQKDSVVVQCQKWKKVLQDIKVNISDTKDTKSAEVITDGSASMFAVAAEKPSNLLEVAATVTADEYKKIANNDDVAIFHDYQPS